MPLMVSRIKYQIELSNLISNLPEHHAVVITSFDEWLGEYVPEEANRLYLTTGFIGSFGVAIMHKQHRIFLTDSRYIKDAMQQLPDYEVILYNRENIAKLPPYTYHIDLSTAPNNLVEYFTKSHNTILREESYITVTPQTKEAEYYSIDIDETLSRHRLALIIPFIQHDYLLVTKSDAVSWLLNIRATDIPYCGMSRQFLMLKRDGSYTLHHNFAALQEQLANIATKKEKVQCDTKKAVAYFSNCYKDTIVHHNDIIGEHQAIKTAKEISDSHLAHLYDGIALLKLEMWLEEQLANNVAIYEHQVAEKLIVIKHEVAKLYQEIEFIGPSFPSIIAYDDNASIIHYRPQKGKDSTIKQYAPLLLDTGSHYRYATTDVTRVWHFGSPSKELQQAYTLVLKGLINATNSVLPLNSKARILDTIARQSLWSHGYNFAHSSGHGVGAYLSVHETPPSISSNSEDILKPGMIFSIEPGYYPSWGIRLENLLCITEQDGALHFTTLTMAPFALHLLDKDLLSPKEYEWIVQYHQYIAEKFAGYLSTNEQLWYNSRYNS